MKTPQMGSSKYVHGDQVVRYQAHCPVRQIYGYPRCHCTPPLGKYLHRIARADTMVINFRVKKSSCGVVMLLTEASIQEAQNGPSRQLIEATSCVEKSNAMIKAKELNYLSSYQMQTKDKNWQSH